MRPKLHHLPIIFSLLAVLISIPATVYLVKQRQELRSKAQEVQTESLLASSTGKLGFNYYPYGDATQSAQFHYINGWFSFDWLRYKPRYEKDLKIMKSFGVSVLRFSLFPSFNGYMLNGECKDGDRACPGGRFTPVYQQLLQNLPEILRLANDDGFKVIITPIPQYLYWHPGNQNWMRKTSWQWAYGNTEQGLQRYINDQMTFSQGIINATYQAPNILYYDISNESFSDPLNNPLAGRARVWDFVKYAWDNLQNIPTGKWGISILCATTERNCRYASNDLVALEATLSGTIRGKEALKFIDFHAYPRWLSQPDRAINMNIPLAYNIAASNFPNAKVILGEYGMRFNWIDTPPGLTDAQKEDVQVATESGTLYTGAFSLPISNIIHWQLWDVCIPGCDQEHRGWGYSPAEPRDVYGKMAERFSLIPNSDFEQGTTSPTGWSVGGNGASLQWGSGEPDSATNNHYGRVRTSSSNALVWLTHNVLNIPQTTTGFELYLNAYLRSNMNSVIINIVEYDGNRNRTRVTSMPSYVPTPGQWENLQYKVGPWKMTLLPATRYLNVSFGGTSGTALPATLDVDAVTLNLRNLPTVPTPTPTPTPSPTPTLSPTPTPTPTPSPVPTISPTPSPTFPPQQSPLSFKIKFQGVGVQRGDKQVRVTLKSGQVFENVLVTSDSQGVYSGSINNITPGTYEVLVKGPSHLQKNFGQVTFTAGQTTNKDWSNFSLLAGDFNGDNLLTMEDLGLILSAYTQLSVPIPPGNPIYDVTFDNRISIEDVALPLANYTDFCIPGDDAICPER